jgi:hypothetical protein
MDGELLAIILVVALVAPLLLTPVALLRRSWLLMWAAAAFSLATTFITAPSIGSFIFLITALQFAAAVALRWAVDPRGRAALLLLAALIWAIALAVQVALGWPALWVVALPLVVIAASVAMLKGRGEAVP